MARAAIELAPMTAKNGSISTRGNHMPVPNGYSLMPPKKQTARSNPKPPDGYSLQILQILQGEENEKNSPFTKTVNGTLNQPLSSDIEDRRNPTFTGKIKEAVGYGQMRAGQVWDELKREVQGTTSGVKQ